MTELKIFVDEKGHVQVSGPLHDKIMCHRLLNIAYDLVTNFKPKDVKSPEEEHRIIPVTTLPRFKIDPNGNGRS